jgi:hypothetical protein
MPDGAALPIGGGMRLVGVISALALLALVAIGATGAQRGDSELILRPGATGTLASTDLFRLQVSVNGQARPDEWLSPRTGAYSTVLNGTKYWFDRGEALVYGRYRFGGERALYHGDHEYLRAISSPHIFFRTGSMLALIYVRGHEIGGDPKPTFKASTHHGRTVLALHAFKTHDDGSTDPFDYRVTVVERITLSEARHRGLLHGTVKPTSTTWQSRPGTPSRLGLAAYWLGHRSGAHVAVMVAEKSKEAGAPESYLVWYAAPSADCAMRDGTAGKNHWWPGLRSNDCDEWMITTLRPEETPNLDSQSAPKKITLADGTQADLLAGQSELQFYVRTRDALVEVSTDTVVSRGSRLAIAQSLRRVKP